jgi:hypothetical protein
MIALFAVDNFLHVGNVLYLLAYLVRDVLWLRLLTVAGMISLMAWYWLQPTPMYGPIAWNSLFLLVNVVQIGILILERRPVFLGEEEMHLYRTVFRSLKPREFTRLLQFAEWRRGRPGDELVAQQKPVETLALIYSGRASVEVDGRHVADVHAGQYVGEMGFLTDQVASARVIVRDTTEYLAWPTDKLRQMLLAHPSLHLKFQGILGRDLVGKLHNEALSAAHPSQVATQLRNAGVQ